MKKFAYRVYFKAGGYVDVSAFTRIEAKILAQAERVKLGMSYLVSSIESMD